MARGLLFLVLLALPLGAFVLLQQGGGQLLLVLLSLSVAVPVAYLVVDRFVQKNQLLEMKEQALQAELDALKQQINPHFFFNTLNNLYGLAQSGSEDTAPMILRLSDLMRFTIYEGRKEQVMLRDELAFLENYLAIQRIRTRLPHNALRLETQISDDGVTLPPLLLIILLENAVKHGLGTVGEQGYLHARIKADLHRVVFICENNFKPRPDHQPGIGMENLNRRLALHFPKRHVLEIQKGEDVYGVRLTLELQ